MVKLLAISISSALPGNAFPHPKERSCELAHCEGLLTLEIKEA